MLEYAIIDRFEVDRIRSEDLQILQSVPPSLQFSIEAMQTMRAEVLFGTFALWVAIRSNKSNLTNMFGPYMGIGKGWNRPPNTGNPPDDAQSWLTLALFAENFLKSEPESRRELKCSRTRRGSMTFQMTFLYEG